MSEINSNKVHDNESQVRSTVWELYRRKFVAIKNRLADMWSDDVKPLSGMLLGLLHTLFIRGAVYKLAYIIWSW